MSISHKSCCFLSALLSAISLIPAVAQSSQGSIATDLAQRQVINYLAKLADLHCNETVTQEKLAANGHVEASEHARYDYLVMIDGSGDEFQLNESRIESSAPHHKPLPMLVTNGFSTVLLVFHPYYRDSFTFVTDSDEVIDGRDVVQVRFSQIHGRRSPAALALRGREFPIELKGTAWLDRKSGEVAKIDASLLHDMSDVGLRSLTIHVEYKPVRLGKAVATMTLPSVAIVDVTTPLQHWRNTHTFDGYQTFSTDAEQDSEVKVRTENAAPNKDNINSTTTANPKENP